LNQYISFGKECGLHSKRKVGGTIKGYNSLLKLSINERVL